MKTLLRTIFSKALNVVEVPGLHLKMISEGGEYDFFGGHRVLGSNVPLLGNEHWHIGSCSKTFTASLVAKLCQLGKINYGYSEAHSPTLSELLTHQTNISNSYPEKFWKYLINSEAPPRTLRAEAANFYLTSLPRKASNDFSYNNWNYIVVGNLLENAFDTSFEELLRTYILEPLNIKELGFGAPGIDQLNRQPWGHCLINETITAIPPSRLADNPLCFSPASGIHLSMKDWANFIKREMHEMIADPASFSSFSATINRSAKYLNRGWIQLKFNNTSAFTHSGSNTMWYSLATIVPQKKSFWIVSANSGTQNVQAEIEELNAEITKLVVSAKSPVRN